MKKKFIREELLNYINNEIKEKYKGFDKAHSIAHFNFVTNNCIEYGNELIKQGYDVNLEIAYVVGAFHDIGIINGREGHAKSSGAIVRNDSKLKEFYDEEVVEMIAQAVEDHSSHLEYEPRSIYGKIVADADRNNSLYLVFSRPVKYGIKNEKQYDREYNMAVMGAYLKIKPVVEMENVDKGLAKCIPARYSDLIALNKQAIEEGMNSVERL